MSFEILVPSLPESVADATLVTWHKREGDWVNENDNLADLETDKVILEVPAPAAGFLSQIRVPEGTTVVGGELLAVIDIRESQQLNAVTEAEDDEMAFDEDDEDGLGYPMSPAVRRMVVEHQLDPAKIVPSGKHGRILKGDVMDHLSALARKQINAQPSTFQAFAVSPQAVRQSKVIEPEPTPALSAGSVASLRPEQRVPMTRLRAKVAERLLQAQQNAAMLTTFNEVNLKAVIELRQQYKDRFEQKHGIKLGFMSFFVKASIEALKRFPAINASIDGNDIIYHGYYDIGIAVSTPRGLIVPILRDADQLDFAGIEKSITDFGSKAKNGSISVEDLSGGTFTITNGGIFGSMLSTPILNPPQCAILGMHAIKDRPVVEDGEIVIRPIMYLALSYDHRLVDGKEAVQFLGTIKECLEAPAHLLLNI